MSADNFSFIYETSEREGAHMSESIKKIIVLCEICELWYHCTPDMRESETTYMQYRTEVNSIVDNRIEKRI